MTRREEIRKATEVFLNDKDPNLAFALGVGFMFGAEWADEHSRKGLVDIDKVCEWIERNFNMPGDFKSHLSKAMGNE